MTPNDLPMILRERWQRCSPRERAMLAFMGVALAAFVAVYGLFLPLRQARDTARQRQATAAMELATVQLELNRLQARAARAPAPNQPALDPRTAVLEVARNTGLVIERQRPRADGGFGIETDAVLPAQLFAWLDGLRLGHGLAPERLSVAAHDGRLRMQAEFAPTP